MNIGQKTPGCFELAIDERRVSDEFRLGIRDLGLPPALDLAPHGLEIPLDAIHFYREHVDQVEALRVLC